MLRSAECDHKQGSACVKGGPEFWCCIWLWRAGSWVSGWTRRSGMSTKKTWKVQFSGSTSTKRMPVRNRFLALFFFIFVREIIVWFWFDRCCVDTYVKQLGLAGSMVGSCPLDAAYKYFKVRQAEQITSPGRSTQICFFNCSRLSGDLNVTLEMSSLITS